MWPHFVHLLSRIIHGMPVLVSSNWASWLIVIGSFLLTEGLLLWRERDHIKEFWKKRWSNLALGMLVTAIVYTGLFLWSTFQTVYDDHHDSVGRWQMVVREKDSLKTELKRRADYIKVLEGKKCPTCPQGRAVAPIAAQPRGLTELQRTILLRDLKEGTGLRVRINSMGKLQDTHDFADELQAVFRGWQIERDIVGVVSSNIGTPASELEFAIPQPQDRAVQIAIHAFDHAHIQYTKNVDPYAYRGPSSAGEPPPALTINVRDR